MSILIPVCRWESRGVRSDTTQPFGQSRMSLAHCGGPWLSTGRRKGDKEKGGERGVMVERKKRRRRKKRQRKMENVTLGAVYMELSVVIDGGSSHLNPSLHLHEGVQNLL